MVFLLIATGIDKSAYWEKEGQFVFCGGGIRGL